MIAEARTNQKRRRCKYTLEPEAEAFAAGDSEAYNTLFRRYESRLRYVARRCLERDANYRQRASEHDIDDLIQAMLLSVWQYRKSSGYTVDMPVYVWLRGCLWRTYLKRRKMAHAVMRRPQQGRVVSLERVADAAGSVSVDHSRPDARAIREETIEVIDTAVSQLAPKRRETVGGWMNGQSILQIGERRGVTHQAVTDMLKRTIRQLAQTIVPALTGQPV